MRFLLRWMCSSHVAYEITRDASYQYETSGDQDSANACSKGVMSYSNPGMTTFKNVGMNGYEFVLGYSAREFGSPATYSVPNSAPDGLYSFKGLDGTAFPSYTCGAFSAWTPSPIVDVEEKKCQGRTPRRIIPFGSFID